VPGRLAIPVAVSAGEPDENGIYRLGGSIEPPKRADVARYPPEARAAGIRGAVLVEIVIDEAGDVSDAKVLRS
jgi:outer membrane biosynthesis protein TonB